MARAKKPKVFDFKQWMVWQLRRASYKWPGRYKAVAAARVDRGQYKCAICGELFGTKQIALDHIEPVVDPKIGFVDWNTFIKRMFVEPDGYQVLCRAKCHKIKTKQETKQRTRTRRKKKNAS
jgi:5-methylcytosine-specific restriction endonuclease McrA